jgi:hypothetical protein
MLGWAVAAFTITIATSLARRSWPGLIWLAITLILNLAAALTGRTPEPTVALALGNFLLHVTVFTALRLFRRESDPRGWLIGWQIGGITTFVWLLFFDGNQYNWWNWALIAPISLFLSEIWPLYWLIIRPIFGG